jgi:DNA-binding NarL/FixJ family response regulator
VGGTLVITRDINNHSYYKKQLEAVGFPDVTPTLLDKDALDFQIDGLKPTYAIMGARFYQCCTPFLVGELKQKFPETKFTAVSIGEYPLELAMYFILNGAGSYITTTDGFEKVLGCLAEIPKGREFISPAVLERKELRQVTPKPAGKISYRHREVMRLICCGFKDLEIADNLHISRRTVDNHKTEIFTSLNVRNAVELIIAALTLKIVPLDELYFYPRNYTVNPLPDAKIKGRRRNDY